MADRGNYLVALQYIDGRTTCKGKRKEKKTKAKKTKEKREQKRELTKLQ